MPISPHDGAGAPEIRATIGDEAVDLASWAEWYDKALFEADGVSVPTPAPAAVPQRREPLMAPHVQQFLDWLAVEFSGCAVMQTYDGVRELVVWIVTLPRTKARLNIEITQEAIDHPQDLIQQAKMRIDGYRPGQGITTLRLVDLSADSQFHAPV